MEDRWDSEEKELFEPPPPDPKFFERAAANKWEGEDEEEDIKDSWEDADEEKKDVEKASAEAPKPKPKPKKALAERIEEREKKAREEAEQKMKEKEEALTPEERRAEQLRRQRLQEEADLRLAMETFGVTEGPGIDGMMPDTKEDFDKFCEVLLNKITQFSKHNEYPGFSEELIKGISVTLPSVSLKRIKVLIDNLVTEKQKLEKAKKGNKNKGKAKLRVEGENTILNEYGDYNDYDEFGDFM